MKSRNLVITFVLALSTFAITCDNSANYEKAPKVNLSTNIDSVSFALGYQNAFFLASEGVEGLNYEQYLSGFINGMDGNESLDNFQRNQIINEFRISIQQAQFDKNTAKGEEFLAANRNKAGVRQTDSGLQIRVIEEGSGKSPKEDDEVEVHYEGTLISGEVFDSSYQRGETAIFPLNRVIPGWTEGVQLMKEGGTYELVVPGNLAYGPNAPGGLIGPNETLIFKVELIKVQPNATE